MSASNNDAPLISILIPAYNAEAYITKALESVLRQTVQDIEVIVVDDASTDGTVGKVQGFDDSRIRLITKQKNEGAQATRNQAMERARGEWIAFLDADDWYAPFRLERLLHHTRQEAVDVVADNVFRASCDLALSNVEGLYIDRFGQVNTLPRLFKGRFLRSLPRMLSPAEFMRGDMPGPRNPCFGLMKPLFRRAFLEKHGILWDERVRYSQDTVFYLSCLVRGACFLVVPETGYFYRTNTNGISASADLLEATRHRHEVNHRLLEEFGGDDPELRRVLEKRARRYERMIAFLRMDRLREAPNATFTERVREHPEDALGFLSYVLEREFWRGVSRLRSIPRRVQARVMKREPHDLMEAKM